MLLEIAIAIAIIIIGFSVGMCIQDIPAAVTTIAGPAVKAISKGASNMISYSGAGIAVALVACSIIYIVLHHRRKKSEGAR